jgi:hypothetical protein
MFSPTSMISLMVIFRTFSLLLINTIKYQPYCFASGAQQNNISGGRLKYLGLRERVQ